MDQAWKRVLSSRVKEYASALRRSRASVMREYDKLLWRVARCTALISACLDDIHEELPVEGESGTVNDGSGRPAETSREVACDGEGQL